MKTIVVGRIPVTLFTEETLHDYISKAIAAGDKRVVLNTNAYLVTLANSKAEWLVEYFRNEVDTVMCDGAGIKLGALLTGQEVPQKIPYNVWFWTFSALCAKRGYSIYLLGGKPGVAQRAAERLAAASPGLKIHHHHGYFNKQRDAEENRQVLREISEIKPNVLLVCFGMPLQEQYIRENIGDLSTNILMTGGGALDFFSGDAQTAPLLLRKLYLEWLFRMLREPRRLWKRYLIGNFQFLYYVIKYRKVK